MRVKKCLCGKILLDNWSCTAHAKNLLSTGQIIFETAAQHYVQSHTDKVCTLTGGTPHITTIKNTIIMMIVTLSQCRQNGILTIHQPDPLISFIYIAHRLGPFLPVSENGIFLCLLLSFSCLPFLTFLLVSFGIVSNNSSESDEFTAFDAFLPFLVFCFLFF